MAKVKLTVKFPLWASLYIYSCIIFARVFGYQPDIDKISKKVSENTSVVIK